MGISQREEQEDDPYSGLPLVPLTCLCPSPSPAPAPRTSIQCGVGVIVLKMHSRRGQGETGMLFQEPGHWKEHGVRLAGSMITSLAVVGTWWALTDVC